MLGTWAARTTVPAQERPGPFSFRFTCCHFSEEAAAMNAGSGSGLGPERRPLPTCFPRTCCCRAPALPRDQGHTRGTLQRTLLVRPHFCPFQLMLLLVTQN